MILEVGRGRVVVGTVERRTKSRDGSLSLRKQGVGRHDPWRAVMGVPVHALSHPGFSTMPYRLVLLVLLALPAFVASAAQNEPQLTPLVAEVLAPPAPVPGSDGRNHIVYELSLANGTGGNVDIETIDVLDRATGKVLLTLGRDDVAKRLSLGGRRGAESARLGAAQFGIVFMHLALADPVPHSLAHRVVAHLDQPDIEFTMTVAETRLDDRPLMVLGPPLLGENYLAGGRLLRHDSSCQGPAGDRRTVCTCPTLRDRLGTGRRRKSPRQWRPEDPRELHHLRKGRRRRRRWDRRCRPQRSARTGSRQLARRSCAR